MLVSGIGYDNHRLEKNRVLIIGGVKIPFEKGLKGHSDADVLIHAVIDAILGASGEKDIGTFFPNTDPTYKNISSLELLKIVAGFIKTKVVYIDAVVVAEQPKLMTFVDEMKSNISDALGITVERVNIKAKTNEGIGSVGRGEGISAYVISTVDRNFSNE